MADEILSKLLTEEDCYRILEQHYSIVENLHILNYEINKASLSVVGYLGDHFRLKIIYRNRKPNRGDVLEDTFFVKTVPIFNKTQEKYVNDVGLFKKESLLYKNILPKLSAIAGVYFAPRCYLITEKCMVFEDLLQRNFKMNNNSNSCDIYLNLKECESLIVCLAKFHCASLVYEELNPIKFDEEFQEELRETAFSFEEGQPRNMWLKNNTKCVADCIKKLPSEFEDSEEIIKRLNEVAFEKMIDYIKPSKKFRNAVTHCDLWSNNFLMNDQLECVLVDFQLARYSPPAYDFMLTLLLNTRNNFLVKNLNYLLDKYYKTFEEMLLKYRLDPEIVFPKDKFLESIEYVRLPTVLEAVFFTTNTLISQKTSSFILADSERFHEFSFINRSKYVMKELDENESFKSGLLELLKPLVECLLTSHKT